MSLHLSKEGAQLHIVLHLKLVVCKVRFKDGNISKFALQKC